MVMSTAATSDHPASENPTRLCSCVDRRHKYGPKASWGQAHVHCLSFGEGGLRVCRRPVMDEHWVQGAAL